MKTDLEGKVILITGASGAIGAEIARAFAAEGASLILHSHSRPEVVEHLLAKLPTTPSLAVQGDLTDEAQVGSIFQQATKAFGRVDTLVANAGIWVEEAVPLQQMSLAQWRRTLDVDLTSVFLCCREFFKQVAGQHQGNVVLVSSTAGVFGEAGHADYAAAKSALAYGLLRTLKNEIVRLAPHTADYCGGRVNCVSPGWTVSPMTAIPLQDASQIENVTATMALPQLARARDVANAVLFLASDTLARHVTGENMIIAGGMEGRLLWRPGEADPHTA